MTHATFYTILGLEIMFSILALVMFFLLYHHSKLTKKRIEQAKAEKEEQERRPSFQFHTTSLSAFTQGSEVTILPKRQSRTGTTKGGAVAHYFHESNALVKRH